MLQVSDERTKSALLRQTARISLIDFIREAAPWFRMEAIHVAMCIYIEKLIEGDEFQRLMIHTPPRTGKSKVVSVLTRAWLAGNFPSIKLLNASHTQPFATDFANETLEIMQSDAYREMFPEIVLTRDATLHFTFHSTEATGVEEGSAVSVGAGSRIAGRGFNVCSLDDILTEQDFTSDVVKPRLFSWYENGVYTRRQPEWNRILVVATRWTWDDPPGRILEKAKETGEKWEVLSIPAILDQKSHRILTTLAKEDDGFAEDLSQLKVGGSFMPGRMPLSFIEQSRGMPTFEAQYMQRPSREEGAIFKRKYFRKWPQDKELPDIDLMFSFYDTAFEAKETNSYTARLTVGVFVDRIVAPTNKTEHRGHKLLLIEADQKHIEAADLFDEAVANHRHWQEQCQQHVTVVERKASGIELIQRLRRAHVPCIKWPPTGVQKPDKTTCAHMAVIDIAAGDLVYLYDGDGREETRQAWHEMFLNEVTRFPLGEHDDMPDVLSMCVMFFRRVYLLNNPIDFEDEVEKKPVAPPRFGGDGIPSYGRL